MKCTLRFLCQARESAAYSEKVAEAEVGELLTQVAYRAGVLIQQTCGGTPSCTDCKVIVKNGVDTGFEAPLGPELRLMGNVYYITHERLACQAQVKGDSSVYVPLPPEKRAEKYFRKNTSRVGEHRDGKEKENRSKEKGKTREEKKRR